MKLIELTNEEFDNFATNHPYNSIYQTSKYGEILAKYFFEYKLVGYKENDVIVAAALILIRDLANKYKYGYCPKGYLINYLDKSLLKKFTKGIKKYFRKLNVIMIKIDPGIIINEIDSTNNFRPIPIDTDTSKLLCSLGYIKLKNNIYFEAQFPRFNGIIDLNQFSGLSSIDFSTSNNITKNIEKGLEFDKGFLDDISTIYSISTKEKYKTLDYYRDLFNKFSATNSANIFTVNINYDNYLSTSRFKYQELKKEYDLVLIELQKNPTSEVANKKNDLAKKLNQINDNINEAIANINQMNNSIAAGIMTIKQGNTVYIVLNGYDSKYAEYAPLQYLSYKVLEYYKNEGIRYVDLNGMVGDFSETNPYKEINDFKLLFRPRIFEYIGEFDLPIKKSVYTSFNDSGVLAKEFNKNLIKEEK